MLREARGLTSLRSGDIVWIPGSVRRKRLPAPETRLTQPLRQPPDQPQAQPRQRHHQREADDVGGDEGQDAAIGGGDGYVARHCIDDEDVEADGVTIST
jgi:hypothetical protein